MRSNRVLCFLLVSFLPLFAQDTILWDKMYSSALLHNQSYKMLQNICDKAGGRLTGTKQNALALNLLKSALEAYGLSVKLEKFSMPGWFRGRDKVMMLSPSLKELKATALGYVDRKEDFSAPLVFAGYGQDEEFIKQDVQNKIVLVNSERPPGGGGLMRFEIIQLALKHGAAAVLFINTKKGNITLAGTASFQGNPVTLPAYSITLEEGRRLKRLLESEVDVKLSITTNSYCTEIETANLVAVLPGREKAKIVVGAHIDSWDLSQGAIDNGIGTAVVFETARLLKEFSAHNRFSIDFVWFNAEELGLFGSKYYLECHSAEDIIAMINLDMTALPTGINVMGYDKFIPFFENILDGLDFDLKKGVFSRPWTNSDHMPFMLRGIPSFTLSAHLEKDMGYYYHSSADSFDKVNKKYLSEAAALVSVMVQALANSRNLTFTPTPEKETVELLNKYKLSDKLMRQGEWPFQ